MIVAKVSDRAGNVGAAGRARRRRRARSPAAPGSRSARSPPSRRCSPCARASASSSSSTPAARSYRWRVRRVGAARPVKRGTAGTRACVMRAPERLSGVYLLELRHGRGTARVPFLVQANERSPLLVVVPAITWLGTDQVDDDRSTACRTRSTNGGPVRWPRVLGRRRPAAGRLRRPGRAAARLPRPPRRSATTSRATSTLDARRAATRARPTARACCSPGSLRWVHARAGAPAAPLRPRRRPARARSAPDSPAPRRRCACARDDAGTLCARRSRPPPTRSARASSRVRRDDGAPLTVLDQYARRAARLMEGALDAAAASRARGVRRRSAPASCWRRSAQSSTDEEAPDAEADGQAAAGGAPGADRGRARQGHASSASGCRSGRSGSPSDPRSRRSRATSSTSCAASRRGSGRRAMSETAAFPDGVLRRRHGASPRRWPRAPCSAAPCAGARGRCSARSCSRRCCWSAEIWNSPQIESVRDRPGARARRGRRRPRRGRRAGAGCSRAGPGCLGVLALAALPFRVPVQAGGATANLLVPLYVVIGAGALAWLVPRLRRPARWRAAARRGRAGVGAARAASCSTRCSRSTADDRAKALEQVVFFYVPFALLFALLRGLRVDAAAAGLGRRRAGRRWRSCSPRSASGSSRRATCC